MLALDSLVPGFDLAIARMPGAAPAWRVLTNSIEAEPMPRRRFVAEIARLVEQPSPAWMLDPDLAGDPAHAPRTLRFADEG